MSDAGMRIFSGLAEFNGFDDFLEKKRVLIMTQAFEIRYYCGGGGYGHFQRFC